LGKSGFVGSNKVLEDPLGSLVHALIRGEKAKAPKPIEHCFKNNLRVASCASSKWASSARLNLLLFMTRINF
jgi:hypothetical protein